MRKWMVISPEDKWQINKILRIGLMAGVGGTIISQVEMDGVTAEEG